MIDEGDCVAIGGMKIGRGNRSTRRKPAPAPLCPPQIPHDQTRTRTRAAAVGIQITGFLDFVHRPIKSLYNQRSVNQSVLAPKLDHILVLSLYSYCLVCRTGVFFPNCRSQLQCLFRLSLIYSQCHKLYECTYSLWGGGETLCYKLEGHGFDSLRDNWTFFSFQFTQSFQPRCLSLKVKFIYG
jgi:hypothetical protein